MLASKARGLALNKILDYVLKAAISLVVGRGGYEIFDGRWFGSAIFSSYLRQRHVDLTSPVSDDLYRDWGSSSVQFSLSHVSSVAMLLTVVLLFGLFAHVIFKPYVAPELASPAVAHPSFKRRVWSRYLCSYHWFTLLIIVLLTCIYFFVPLGYGLGLDLVLIGLPSALYLFLYSKDIVQGVFLERFVWTCLLLLLVASLIQWPALYGRTVFSPEFFTVTLPNQNPDTCSAELRKGPIFLAWRAKDKAHSQLCRLCFDASGDRFIDFFESGDFQVVKKANLTSTIDSFVPPVSVEEGNKAIAEAEKALKPQHQ